MEVELRAVTIAELVYRKLKEEIISGKLKPGSRIIETNVASRYKVSRTPLREALKLLEQDHLVERLPQGGVLVVPISYEEAREYNEMRASLECLMARLAAEKVRNGNLTEPDRELLEQLITITREAKLHLRIENYDTLLAYGAKFHETLHRLAGNRRAATLLVQIIESMQRYRLRIPKDRQKCVTEEHTAIAEAIAKGDVESADSLMEDHIFAAEIVYNRSIEMILSSNEYENE